MVLLTKEDLKEAAVGFHDLCARKKMSTHPGTSYHVTFARTCKEEEFPSIFQAMGLRIHGEDETEDKFLPYAISLNKNPSMPVIQVYIMAKSSSAAPDKLTFEWHRADKQVWVKASRNIIVERLCLLLGFFGRVSDIRGQQSHGKPRSTSKKASDLEFGAMSVEENMSVSLGLQPARKPS